MRMAFGCITPRSGSLASSPMTLSLMRYLEAAHFDAVTWEIVPGTTYERAILGKVDTTTPEYRAFREAICKDALGRMGLGHLLKTKEKEAKEVGYER